VTANESLLKQNGAKPFDKFRNQVESKCNFNYLDRKCRIQVKTLLFFSALFFGLWLGKDENDSKVKINQNETRTSMEKNENSSM
jgi:hypothetical protein